jgi:diadenosine tetraphosphate (Ap4A) HIT family hydrolase
MIMEGMWVNHLHIKLYPMWNLNHEWTPIEERENVFYESYPWFLTTKMWKALSQEELAEVANEILGK